MRLLAFAARAAVVVLVAGTGTPSIAAERPGRPNFLLLIADDLCWRDLGCTGNPDVKTPHIDRLAREGMTLRGLFSSSATCSPVRHALYTGLYPVRSGAYPNHTTVDEGTRSVFSHLKSLGYRVGLQAKTHIRPPSSFPFEMISKDADDIGAFTRFVTREKGQPWLAVFASHDPHGPWTRGPRDLYDPAKLTVPPYLHDNSETRRGLARYYAEVTKLDEQVGACVRAVDESDQREATLVLFVSEQGASFPYGGKWSLYDNGIRVAAFARWPGRVRAGSASDALLQYVDVAPTFIAAAGADPTTLDTGCPDLEGHRGFDGRSFLAVLLGETDRHRDHVFGQHTAVGVNGYKYPYPNRSVRDSRYKLIRNLAPENEYSISGIHGDPIFKSWRRDAETDPALATRVRFLSFRPAEELYDLDVDPFEAKNLAADPKYAEIKERLKKQLDAWMARQGDAGLETELKAESRQPGRQAAKNRAASKADASEDRRKVREASDANR